MKPKWLIEAEKYIGQKEIKGSKHNPLILLWWKLIKRGGIKTDEVPWCFTGETQILTEEGFIRFDELKDQKVYQVDKSLTLSLVKPIQKIEKEYQGKSFHLKTRSIDITCDIGHRWYGTWGKTRQGFDTLDFIPSDGLSVPPVQSPDIPNQYSLEELKLIAAFMSDGKYRYSNGRKEGYPWSIDFEVSKQRKIDALNSFNVYCPDHEYTQAKTYGPLTLTPLTVFRFKFPEFFKTVFKDYKILTRDFINSLSQKQARYFLECYSIFDGTDYPNKVSLYTGNTQIKDDLITIAVLAGYLPSVNERSPSKLSKKTTSNWTIVFSKTKKARHLKSHHVIEKDFNGKMYCVEVPEGKIVVRGSESTAPILTGNCAAFTGSMLETVGITSSRFESAKSYLAWGTTLPAPLVGCIVVFEREGGGHVGFVEGQDVSGNLIVLGGNQGDMVKLSAFPRSRVSGYRWPKGFEIPKPIPPLPVVNTVQVSTKES